MINIIEKYFNLTDVQRNQFEGLAILIKEWNTKINVISKKDIVNIFENHILHSLSIAKIIKFKENTKILDLGTGGGFPGLPLAIMFPNANFHLVDSIGKKIMVVSNIIEKLEITNVKATNTRAEVLKSKYDFVVTRAVAQMDLIERYSLNLLSKEGSNELKNGIIALKGGNLDEELFKYKNKIKLYNIKDFFNEEFFFEKKVIYLQL